MERIKIKNRKIDTLLILAMFILVRICCPALSNIPIFSMAFTFIYGVGFVFLYFLIVGKMNIRDFYLMVAAFLYAAYVFLRGVSTGNGLFARDPFNAYVVVFLTMIYIWIKEKPTEIKMLFFRIILFALIFDYAYSIYVLIQDPDASRMAAVGGSGISPYDILTAVGSFDAVYGGLSVVVILLCVRQVLKKKHIKNITTLIVLLLAIAFIIMASYATAILLLICSLALFFRQKSKAFSVLVLVAVILFIIFHKAIGQWLMDMSPNITYSEKISEKMNDFGYMLKYFEASGTYAGEEGRTAKMIYSWETFLKYPFFGGIGMDDAKVYGHCELLDFPGNFGLVGFAFLITYFVCLYKNIRLLLSSKEMRTCWKIILFVFAVSAALNPSLYSLQMMPLILMMPLAPSYIEMCENHNKSGE